MADLFSDTDESAVDELISQAKDLCVLEQVAAINCSSFTDSPLPTEIESRFRKLKSFPQAPGGPSVVLQKKDRSYSMFDDKSSIFSPSNGNPDERKVSKHDSFVDSDGNGNPGAGKSLKQKSGSGSSSSPLNSSNSSMEMEELFSASKRIPQGRNASKLGSFHSPLDSLNSSRDLESPPRRMGCFWCSPKRVSKKKVRENRMGKESVGLDLEYANDEILSDLGILSAKEQKRILKKAMEEEDKLNREAEKIVKWAKQASARFDDSGIADDRDK